MRILFYCGCLTLALSGLAASAAPEESVKQDLKTAGKEVGHAAKEVGHAVKHGALTAGHVIRKGAKEAAHGVKHAAKKIAGSREP